MIKAGKDHKVNTNEEIRAQFCSKIPNGHLVQGRASQHYSDKNNKNKSSRKS